MWGAGWGGGAYFLAFKLGWAFSNYFCLQGALIRDKMFILAIRVGAYLRWSLVQGWALIRVIPYNYKQATKTLRLNVDHVGLDNTRTPIQRPNDVPVPTCSGSRLRSFTSSGDVTTTEGIARASRRAKNSCLEELIKTVLAVIVGSFKVNRYNKESGRTTHNMLIVDNKDICSHVVAAKADNPFRYVYEKDAKQIAPGNSMHCK